MEKEKEINFLQRERDKQLERKRKHHEAREKVEWSQTKEKEGTGDRGGNILTNNKPVIKRGWFPFFKKDKKKYFDKNKIKESRAEILRTIKKEEAKETKVEGEEKKRVGFWSKIKNYWFKRATRRQNKKQDKKIKKLKLEETHKEKQLNNKTKDDLKEKTEKKEEEFTAGKPSVQREATWSNPDILEADLIKEEAVYFFDWRVKIIYSLIYLALACLLAAGIYQGMVFWKKSEEKKVQEFNQKFITLEKGIKEIEASGQVEKALSLKRKLDLSSNLLDEHIYWSNFFEFLENYTTQDVYFFDFSGDDKGDYSLNGRARDFNALAEQVKIMRLSEDVKEVFTQGGAFFNSDPEGINFDLSLIINREIFKR